MAGAPRFWRPGDDRPQAGAVSSRPSFRVDADGGEEGTESLLGSGRSFPAHQRQQLPVFQHQRAILYLLERHATTVLVGETGSGKSTQIPQYLVAAGWSAGGRMVACTQPRRVAVQTIAARVAEEMGTVLGDRVGYTIRFEDVTTQGKTELKFVTDGLLLKEMLSDPLLERYSVVMIDEAHERTVATDILLGLLKKVQRRRPDLRLIISSATLAAEEIADFFDTSGEEEKRPSAGKNSGADLPSKKPAVISIEGRCHPVQLLYLEEPTNDYVQRTIDTVVDIHRTEGPGDILAFLTGREEVDTVVQLLAEQSQERGLRGITPLPLYAGLAPGDVDRVFAPVFRGQRKVVVATNIAEASITLEGVVYVIDCGFVKQKFYNAQTGVEALVTVPISRASAKQRAGRAGRVQPGKCYRLYTEDAYYNELPPQSIPEIQRSDLAATVLQLKSLGIDNIMRFEWLAPPSPSTMLRSLETLFAIGALDSDARLTRPLGLQLAEIPLEPMVARFLTAAADLGCSEEACIVAACLSVQSVWAGSRGRQREADEMRARFAAAEGDFVTFLNVCEGYKQSNSSSHWCHKNGINAQAMGRVSEVRSHLRKLLTALGLPLKSCNGEVTVVQRAAATAFFANAAELLPYGDGSTYASIRGRVQLKIHPSSALFRVSPKWVVYREAVQSDDRLYMRDVTPIEGPAWLQSLAPHFFAQKGPM